MVSDIVIGNTAMLLNYKMMELEIIFEGNEEMTDLLRQALAIIRNRNIWDGDFLAKMETTNGRLRPIFSFLYHDKKAKSQFAEDAKIVVSDFINSFP